MKLFLIATIAMFSMQLTYAGSPKEKKTQPTNTEVGRFPASTPNYPKYVEECKKPALEKLKSIAEINGFVLDEKSVTISSIDDRWYNPSKYVWFSAVVKKSDGNTDVIQVLTQKSFVPPSSCF